MRFNPTNFILGLLLLVTTLLTACGGGGTTTPPPVATVPAAPTITTPLVAGCYAIDIGWSAVSGATGYNVYFSTTTGGALTKLTATPVTAISYTDTGLSVNTTLYYKVTAVNSVGEGSYSAEASAKTALSCNLKGGSIQGNTLALTTAVSTLAGLAGAPGATDGASTVAQFNFPTGITTDGANLYVADTVNNTIRKIVISTGAVSTVAGNAAVAAGFADGTGSTATFNGPKGITTDGINLYVADTQNSTIRQIDIASGAVTTIAGFHGIATFVDNAFGTSSTFNFPAAITTDGTNLFVADTGNHAIRQITIGGTQTVTTLAGTGIAGNANSPAQFSSPQGITTDGTNLYVADTANSILRQVVISSGVVTTITATGLSGPQGITTDGTNLYIADTANDTIKMVVKTGGTVTTLAGTTTPGSTNGTGSAALFRLPAGITTDGTNLYTVDTGNSTIRKMQ